MKLFSIALMVIFSFMNLYGQAISTPRNVQGISYEQHIDIIWGANAESNLAGYNIYRFDGTRYLLYTVLPKTQTWFTEWYGSMGMEASYKVAAFNTLNQESPLSDSVNVRTRPMTDEEFLDMVQRATFRFFWDYAHPTSGLTRERLGSGNTVTIGGSGFGVMALMVGIERNYITRQQGVERLLRILTFLTNSAQRFRGAFSHWLNGETGVTIPFSQFDNGGDLVETSLMLQGLLAARNYFNGTDANEVHIRNLINGIWHGVEWNWYRRATWNPFLIWHWSPNFGWQMNHRIEGWNEAMICYLLGIASPTHKIPVSSYYEGWASSTNFRNENTYYGHRLYVGPPFGGPLFFAHYSFLGFDPRNKRDAFANYFVHNRNHTLVNRAYAIANPRGFTGYGPNTWGLTASDNPWGYLAHEPFSTDNGTIAPTAALSSMPYTPRESIDALKNFYRSFGNRLWGSFGFRDAFNLHQNWFATSYIAIDQGPIIIMIENYRTQLLWNNFMANPEIQAATDSIFVTDTLTTIGNEIEKPLEFNLSQNYPNPFNPTTRIEFAVPSINKVQGGNELGNFNVTLEVYDLLGNKISTLVNEQKFTGRYQVEFNGSNLSNGIYFYKLKMSNEYSESFIETKKMVLMK